MEFRAAEMAKFDEARKAVDANFLKLCEIGHDLQLAASEPISVKTPFGIFTFSPDTMFSYRKKI